MTLASQLRQIAERKNSNAITKQWDTILEGAKKAATEGKFSYTYYGELSNFIKNDLGSAGFIVSPQRQTGINKIGYDISW